MGVSHSASEFVEKIKAAEANLKASEMTAVRAGGRVAMEVFTVTKDTMGAGGAHGVTVKKRETTSGSHPAVGVKFGPSPGWVAIMEGRVGPHFIGPHQGSTLRHQNTMRGSRRGVRMAAASLFGGTVGAGTKGAINIKGIGPRAWAHHPGVHKKKPFVEAAHLAAHPLATNAMQKVVVVEFGKSFV